MIKIIISIKNNFDKIFFLLQLVVALVVTALTEYVKLDFISSDSLIIYLLVLLTFDVYYIVVHRMDKILDKINLSEKNLDSYFTERNLTISLDSLLERAVHNIFISGSTMVSLLRCETLLREKLQAGIDVTILLWDTCNTEQITALTSFDNSSVQFIANQIKTSLGFLIPLQKEYSSLKIGFINNIILTDYIAIDIDTPQGLIKVQNRFYGEPADKYPNYILESQSSPIWFSKYKDQISKLWQESIKMNNTYLRCFSTKFGTIN